MSVSAPNAHFYAVYLNGTEWGKRRKQALAEAGSKCARCEGTEMLEVHHLTYARLGNERPEDLRVLCNPCHSDEHGRPARGQPVVSLKELRTREIARSKLELNQEDVLGPIAMRAAWEAAQKLAFLAGLDWGPANDDFGRDVEVARDALARIRHHYA